MEKENLILDVDGCVLDFDYAFLPILDFFDIPKSDIISDKWTTLSPDKYPRTEIYKFLEKTWKSYNFEHLPVLGGFHKFVQDTREHFNIIYNTYVPPKYQHKRIKNLNQHGLLNDIGAEIFFSRSAKDKAIIVKDNNGVAFIDDKPENIHIVQNEIPNIKVIWFNYKGFMKPIEADYEAHTWQKVKKLLLKNK